MIKQTKKSVTVPVLAMLHVFPGEYDEMKSPFEWKLMARNLVAMATMGFVFFIITLLCEFRFFHKPK